MVKVYQFALMKENVHRGAHALTSLMFAPSVIMFWYLSVGLILHSCNFFTFAFHHYISK